jgi:TolB-like protein/class 3 adenylate cyclase
MTEQGFKRKLAAILSADVKDYSRMMRDDEDSTIRMLTNYRSAISNLIQKFRGHVVDAIGDNMLAKFASVVDAVNCAVEIQRELAERNAELPDERKMDFRIGVNLGDVVEEEGRIYGDGVNIAARMEGLAEAGGVCISGSVHDSVESKLGLEYEFLGEKEVKNIDKPVRAYRVLTFPGAAAHRVVQAKVAVGKKWRKLAIVAAGVLVVVVAAAALWNRYFRYPAVGKASVENMAYPLPEKPSIAVLPFANMSDDPGKEYLSDGITEQIITSLSKIPRLFVISRTSTFTYKDKPVKVQQVAEELGIRYVLEGSVQQSGAKIRITAQLIDALTGRHIWAKRYERNYKDLWVYPEFPTRF